MTKQTIPTWKQALDIAKSLQLEYQLPIFAMTYKGMCSCCAGAAYFNKEAYFPRNVAKMDAKDIDAYIHDDEKELTEEHVEENRGMVKRLVNYLNSLYYTR